MVLKYNNTQHSRVDRDIVVADTLHFDDATDLFERDPFAVRFEVPHCGEYLSYTGLQ